LCVCFVFVTNLSLADAVKKRASFSIPPLSSKIVVMLLEVEKDRKGPRKTLISLVIHY